MQQAPQPGRQFMNVCYKNRSCLPKFDVGCRLMRSFSHSVIQAAACVQYLVNHRLHAFDVRWIDQCALGVKRIAGTPQRKRLGRYPALRIEQQGRQMALRAQAAHGAG